MHLDFRLPPCFECRAFSFWVVLRRMEFNCQRFETLCLFHLHRHVGTYPFAYEDGTECSETLAIKLHTPEYPLAYEDGTECSETLVIKLHTPE
jgi:hypothetical protein